MARTKRSTPAKRSRKQTPGRDGQSTPEAQQMAKVARLGMQVQPEEAVTKINQLARSGMEAIARYLIDTFFAGDVANVRGEGRNSPGFARLRQYNEQMEVGYSTLCHILRAQKQRHEMEQAGHGELLAQLTLSHQFRLLSVQEPAAKVELLKQAVKRRWTVRQLTEAIAERRPARSPQPLTPRRVLARVDRVDQTLATVDGGFIEAARELPRPDKTKLRKRVDRQLKHLQRLRDALEKD